MTTTPAPVGLRTFKLPALLFREIGRLITIFSCIEHEMNLVTYSLLRLSTAEGRLAVSTFRAKEHFKLIKTLLAENSISVTHDIAPLENEVCALESIRDWLAHGVWTISNGIPSLQITRGTWQPKGSHKGVNKKIIPSVSPMDRKRLREAADDGVQLLRLVEDIHKQILRQLSS